MAEQEGQEDLFLKIGKGLSGLSRGGWDLFLKSAAEGKKRAVDMLTGKPKKPVEAEKPAK